MTEPNPYSTPATTGALTEKARPSPMTRLWLGYSIAPLIAPILAASGIFFGGLFFHDPEDMGTPIGIVLLPVLLLTVGVFLSYSLALILGMPIAFWLRRKRMLTGYTIHIAAIIVSFGLATSLTLVGMFVDGHVSLSEFCVAFSLTFLIISPFILLSTTAFWLIAKRERRA